MTLQEAKDRVAIVYGYKNWEQVELEKGARMHFASLSVLQDEAAELYAKSKWEEACQVMHEKIFEITEEGEKQSDESQGEFMNDPGQVVYDILNMPNPEFKS